MGTSERADIRADIADSDETILDHEELDLELFDEETELPPEPPELPALARFGRYELLGRMAVGGMAEIFLARERGACGGTRQVVVKVLRPQLEHDSELQSLFIIEGRVALRLKHPNVCHAYEVGVEHGRHFIAMEHVHGITLRELLRRSAWAGRHLPTSVLVRIIADVAAALHAAHHARDATGQPLGIVHRDVSPHNVMIGFDGVVKLLDFGVAHARTDAQPREAPGLIRGKLGYLAPEQCVGRPVDARTDVFALGVCLWEGLAGRRLFKREQSYDTLQAIVNEDAPHPGRFGADVSDALAMIAERALQRAPAMRFQSAGELSEALEQYLVDRGERVGSLQIAAFLATFGAGAILPELDRSPRAVAWLNERGRAPVAKARWRGPLVTMGILAAVAVAVAVVSAAWPMDDAAVTPAIESARWAHYTPPPTAPPEPVLEPRAVAAPLPEREPAVAAEPPAVEPELEPERPTRSRRARPRPGAFIDDPGF